MAKTEERVSDVKLDKVVTDNVENLKNWAKGQSVVENWKFIALGASGVLAPTLPYVILLGYGGYKLIYKNILAFEEGTHYEMKTYKEVEDEEEEEK